MELSFVATCAFFLALVFGLVRVLSYYAHSGRPVREYILLSGCSESGKTSLFHYLREGKIRPTVVSMKERIERFSVFGMTDAIPLTFVDSPGHPRLRKAALDYIYVSQKILFLINASKKSTFLTAEAEFLYDLLSHRGIHQNLKILIVQHQLDEKPTSSLVEFQRQLEAELTQLQITRQSIASTEEETGAEEDIQGLGRPGQAFQFAIDAPCEITFGKASCASGKIEDITTFLQQ